MNPIVLMVLGGLAVLGVITFVLTRETKKEGGK